MNRLFMLAILLGGAFAVPYFISSSRSESSGEASSGWPFAWRDEPATSSTTGPPPLGRTGTPTFGNTTPLEGVQIHSIGQVLRFDITQDWVYRTWPRKTTGLSDAHLFGVRVPLVTGTRPNDLAGSLTYYFDTAGQLQHIGFRGRTGDPRPLISFLTQTYEFQPAVAPPGEYLYQVQRRGLLHSELRTRPDSVLRSDSPHTSYTIELALARPGTNRFLAPRGPQLDVPPPAGGVAATPDAAEESAGTSMFGQFVDGIRYATPEEQQQMRWMRWPD